MTVSWIGFQKHELLLLEMGRTGIILTILANIELQEFLMSIVFIQKR